MRNLQANTATIDDLQQLAFSSLAFSSHLAIFRLSNIEGVSQIACVHLFLPFPFLSSFCWQFFPDRYRNNTACLKHAGPGSFYVYPFSEL